MRLLRIPALIFPLVLPLSASDAYEQQLRQALSKHILVLRNFYTDHLLKFDSDGKLLSNGKPGFGTADGRVYVHWVQLTQDKLILTGTRPINVFDPTKESWGIGDTGTSVSIEVALPSGEPANTAVPRLINTVFMTESELANIKCSAEEEQTLLDDIRKPMNHDLAIDAPKLPDVGSLDALHPFCLPGGERVYKVGRGITAPRAQDAPDPTYPEASRRAKLQGTTVLLIIVTPDGQPSTISIQRSLGSGLPESMGPLGYDLDLRAVEAVSQWKFEPSSFAGKPVPVMINVEVNFRLR